MPNLKRLKFFDKDEIEWTSQEPALHNFYKSLTNLKQNNAALHITGNTEILHENYDDNVIVFLRINRNDKVLVVLNLSNKSNLIFDVSHTMLQGNYDEVLSNKTYTLGAEQTFKLQAYECIVLSATGN